MGKPPIRVWKWAETSANCARGQSRTAKGSSGLANGAIARCPNGLLRPRLQRLHLCLYELGIQRYCAAMKNLQQLLRLRQGQAAVGMDGGLAS